MVQESRSAEAASPGDTTRKKGHADIRLSDTCGARAHPRKSGVCRLAGSCSGAQLRRPRSRPQPHARPLVALRLLRLRFSERSRRKASIRTPAPRRRAPCRRQWVLSFRRPRCALRALGVARERVHVTYQRHRDRRAAAPAAPGGGRRPGRPRLHHKVSNVCGRSTPMPSSKPVIPACQSNDTRSAIASPSASGSISTMRSRCSSAPRRARSARRGRHRRRLHHRILDAMLVDCLGLRRMSNGCGTSGSAAPSGVLGLARTAALVKGVRTRAGSSS